MATDAPEETTSPVSPRPMPPAVGEWVENRLDAGVLLALALLGAMSIAVLGGCLWMVAHREPVAVYAGG